MARVDERRALPRDVDVSDVGVRVALDLDGSLESLGNSMTDLADALDATGECDLVRFHSTARASPGDARVALRSVWSPLWRRSRGPSLDRLLEAVDVVHVAGRATPPTHHTPLIISVDDLRPLRGESRERQRVTQLRRAVARGAWVVVSTRHASHEVRRELGVERDRIVVVAPAVPLVRATANGEDLVVNVTGAVTPFLALAPRLSAFATERGSRVVALTSERAGQRIRAHSLGVETRARRDASAALASARVVVHVSDGARFPSFAIAALAAGVPTIARATTINRELLSGAATLTEDDAEVTAAVDALWDSPARRAIAVAAGQARAADFSPATAARAYVALYRNVVRGFAA